MVIHVLRNHFYNCCQLVIFHLVMWLPGDIICILVYRGIVDTVSCCGHSEVKHELPVWLSEMWMTPQHEWLPGHWRLRWNWLRPGGNDPPPGRNDSPMTMIMRYYKTDFTMISEFPNKKGNMYLPQHVTFRPKVNSLQTTVHCRMSILAYLHGVPSVTI